MLSCSSCGEPIDTQPNGRPPLCPECSIIRRRERNQAWKERNMDKVRENWRKNYKKKYTQEPRHQCRPQRGVEIIYHGCASIDHMSKTAFEHYRKDFEPGDQYKIDGVWRTV